MKKKIPPEKPIESVIGVNLGLPNSDTGLMVATAENYITAYRNEAQEALRRGGYPLTLADLWIDRKKHLPDLTNGRGTSQVYNLFWMLWNLKEVEFFIEKNKADQAACSMASAIYWATLARLKPVKPLFDKGVNYGKAQSEKRQKRRTWKELSPEQRAARNKKMVEHFKKTGLSKRSFAERHAAKYGLKPSQIRSILPA